MVQKSGVHQLIWNFLSFFHWGFIAGFRSIKPLVVYFRRQNGGPPFPTQNNPTTIFLKKELQRDSTCKASAPGVATQQSPLKVYPLGKDHISHLRKRNIIFKMPFLGDMLVPWRVLHPQKTNMTMEIATI